jgi:hypothetical protein
MKNKQTAVEWLVKELNQRIDFIPMNQWDMIRGIVQQAKALEREQTENAYDQMRCVGNYENGKQYYNETYGGNK